MTSRFGRVRRLESCPTCGLSVLEIQSHLSRTIDVIERELPPERSEAVIEELRMILDPAMSERLRDFWPDDEEREAPSEASRLIEEASRGIAEDLRAAGETTIWDYTALPRGTPVPVPAEELGELLGAEGLVGEAPVPHELTQREAASLLRVSVSYLRASSCPKHLLPGNGARGRALVRYRRDEVLAWGAARTLAPRIRRA